jgi:acyl-CoA reductase-like NAD-dependent aldehyde dehydrogenase
MTAAPHIPAIRRGKNYESLDTVEVKDYRTGEVMATVSQVNAGIIRKDLSRIAESRAALKKLTTNRLFEICGVAAEKFLKAALPPGNAEQMQSAEDYVRTLSSTSGLPHAMVRRNMQKIHDALANMKSIINGLTRGIDAAVLDSGFGEQAGAPVAFFPTTDALGLVMPSNSPAVNSLWLPAIALKIPVVIKPGRDEPWTPFRLIQAFIAAGCPAEAFSFYPTDHEGSGVILKSCERALLFGDSSTTQQYANNPAIEIHGPGYSKILIGEDQIERWPEFIDVICKSIAENGGRSCINASALIVPRHGSEIAEALAKRLGPIAPVLADDPNAALSGFANPKMADYIDSAIEEGLKTAGAEDVTTKYRNGPRKVVVGGGTYLRPTIVRCESIEHPLANREFLFPYASVIEVPQAEMTKVIGPSLVVTAITQDEKFREELLDCRLIERLNFGLIPTMRISWDQPHEGNMFDFLYKRRAIAWEELKAA